MELMWYQDCWCAPWWPDTWSIFPKSLNLIVGRPANVLIFHRWINDELQLSSSFHIILCHLFCAVCASFAFWASLLFYFISMTDPSQKWHEASIFFSSPTLPFLVQLSHLQSSQLIYAIPWYCFSAVSREVFSLAEEFHLFRCVKLIYFTVLVEARAVTDMFIHPRGFMMECTSIFMS